MRNWILLIEAWMQRRPRSIELTKGVFEFDGATVYVDPTKRDLAHLMASLLHDDLTQPLRVLVAQGHLMIWPGFELIHHDVRRLFGLRPSDSDAFMIYWRLTPNSRHVYQIGRFFARVENSDGQLLDPESLPPELADILQVTAPVT